MADCKDCKIIAKQQEVSMHERQEIQSCPQCAAAAETTAQLAIITAERDALRKVVDLKNLYRVYRVYTGADMKEKVEWRVGSKIKLNVYDELGHPVCQCQNEAQSARIVAAINESAELRKVNQQMLEALIDINRFGVTPSIEGLLEVNRAISAAQAFKEGKNG